MTCCLNCEDRIIGCHSVCKSYKEDREVYDEKKSMIYSNKNEYKELNDFFIERTYKRKKKLKLI